MHSRLRPVRIAGTGSAVPSGVLTNHDLAKRVETSDEWIVSRTGIHERRFCQEGESCAGLGAEAGARALEAAGVKPSEVGCIIVATITPDHIFPCNAAFVQQSLGCDNAAGFDLSAACSGFVYGLTVATHFVGSGLYDHVLLIGSEAMSSLTDPHDRGTCILFGDGAGACVVSAAEEGAESGILHSILRVECDEATLVVPAGGSKQPASHETVEKRQHYMRMNGRATFRFAVGAFKKLYQQTLADTGIDPDAIRWIIPHQVNARIIEAAAKRTGFPLDRIASNLDRFGNTSAAGIPICLDEVVRKGEIVSGDLVLFVAFGAGLTWGSALVRW